MQETLQERPASQFTSLFSARRPLPASARAGDGGPVAKANDTRGPRGPRLLPHAALAGPLSPGASPVANSPTLLAGGGRSPQSPSCGGTFGKSCAQPLCPCLVVPAGLELNFAVREIVGQGRQLTSFPIVELSGKPLSNIIVDEAGPVCGITLQQLNGVSLAYVRTTPVHEPAGGLPEICWPSGQRFCMLVRGRRPSQVKLDYDGSYELRDLGGQLLFVAFGDFREKAVNIVNPAGVPVCATERCVVDGDDQSYYQVRVASCVDAGLMLCALLALDKVEGVA